MKQSRSQTALNQHVTTKQRERKSAEEKEYSVAIGVVVSEVENRMNDEMSSTLVGRITGNGCQ